MSRTSGSCVEEKDEILRKGVRNLVISSKSPQSSSSRVNVRSGTKGVAGEGASLCEKETLASSSVKQCPNCFKVHHPSYCPYFRRLPQGASFGPGCEIVCVCGNYFNEKGWFCTSCGGNRAALRVKHCIICNTWRNHTTDECSKDKALAARFKIAKDKLCSRVPKRIPLPPSETTYVPTSPAFLPTSPAYWYQPLTTDPTQPVVLVRRS